MKNTYLLQGKLSATKGNGAGLAQILLEAAQLMAHAKGCRLYAVSQDEEDMDQVFVTEIWDNKADHDASLAVPGVKELIMQAMPLLQNPPTRGQELKLLGGFGL